jgi:hypothetical protein
MLKDITKSHITVNDNFNINVDMPNNSKENVTKWDNRFLGLAKEISTWSKDPST